MKNLILSNAEVKVTSIGIGMMGIEPPTLGQPPRVIGSVRAENGSRRSIPEMHMRNPYRPCLFLGTLIWLVPAAGLQAEFESRPAAPEEPVYRRVLVDGRQTRDPALEGKRVVVRIYTQGARASGGYVQRTVEVRDHGLDLSGDMGEAGDLVALTGTDQDDELVASALGHRIYIEKFTDRLPFPLSFRDSRERRYLVDGVGDRIPMEKLELTILLASGRRWPNPFNPHSMIRIRAEKLLGKGADRDISPPVSSKSFTVAGWIVHHPLYGTALIRGPGIPDEGPVRIPLVRQGSRADERALLGQVLSPGDVPVADAMVTATSVRTPGEGLIHGSDVTVLSDQAGLFRLYYPIPENGRYQGNLIPLSSRYAIRVEVPGSQEVLPHIGEYHNDDLAVVRLLAGDAYHTFTFLAETGRIEAEQIVDSMRATYQLPGQSKRQPVPVEILQGGGRIPYGEYKAECYGGPDRGEFVPVSVTPESPRELVFTYEEPLIYEGRVVHGVSGEPLAGAFVLGMTAVGGRLADIGPETWESISALPADADPNDERFDPLQRIVGFACVTRSGPNGSYRMESPAGTGAHSLIVCRQDAIGFRVPLHILQPDADNRISVPDVRLYPAARVVVTPHVTESIRSHVPIAPRWIIDEGSNPRWAIDMIPWVTGHRQNEGQFEYDGWIRPGEKFEIQIPANVTMSLRLETPYSEDLGNLTISESINLPWGGLLDLGEHTIPQNRMVMVRVLDDAGIPVEGLPVRKKIDGGWDVAENSDAEGLCKLYVPEQSTIQVGVRHYNRETERSEEATLEISVGNRDEDIAEHTLQVPDGLIGRIFEDHRDP